MVEIGGQWVGPGQKRVLALIAELGLETFPTFAEGRNLFERSGRIRDYAGSIPRVSPLALAEVGASLRRINRMAAAIDPERPWAAPQAERWDSQTFATWMRRNVRTPTARDLMRLAIWAVWAAEPEDLSLLSVLFYIRSAGSFEALIDTEGGAQDSRVVGGSQAISLRMAEELEDSIVLDAPVQRIEHATGIVTVSTAGGVAVEAWRAIVALPPVLAGRITYDPPMPATRDGLTQRMAMGSVVKCVAVYPEPFWRADGLSGQATSADGPVSVTYDNSPPDGSPGVLLAFLEGAAARRAADLPQLRAPGDRPRLPRAPLRRPGRRARALPRQGLGGGPLLGRLLRGLSAHRRLDRERARAARPGRPDSLGRRRDRDGLERLHGRRRHLRRARRRRGARGDGGLRWRSWRWCARRSRR